MAHPDPLDFYHGHCYLETSLFGPDPAQKSFKPKTLQRVVHKRDFPTDMENEKVHLQHHELPTSTALIPDGSLQITTIVGLPRNTPVDANTHQDRRVLASIFSAFNFPLSHASFALSSPRVEHGRLFAGDESDIDGSRNPAFYAAGSRFCVIWRFNTDTKTTRAIVLTYAPPDALWITGFTPMLEMAMQHYSQSFSHPMFMTLLMTNYLRYDAVSILDQDSSAFATIQEQVILKSTYQIGIMQQLRDLGKIYGGNKFIMIACRSCLERARVFNERTYADKDGNFKDQTSQHFLAHLESLRDCVDLDIAFFEGMQANIAHQLTAISTLVNTQDGASMKTIAVITMVFLPGTYLASVFAMPVFPQGHDDAFWLYWAICIPLTVVVCLAWLAWFYLRSSNQDYGSLKKTPYKNMGVSTVPKDLRAEKHDSTYFRRRMVGDRYKEFIVNFNNP